MSEPNPVEQEIDEILIQMQGDAGNAESRKIVATEIRRRILEVVDKHLTDITDAASKLPTETWDIGIDRELMQALKRSRGREEG